VTTVDFITGLSCRVDDLMPDAKKHSQAALYPSEVVTCQQVESGQADTSPMRELSMVQNPGKLA